MLKFPIGKLYNTYIIETSDYESTKRVIMDFAVANGFEKELVYSFNHPDIMYYLSDNSKFSIKELRQEVIDTVCFSPKVSDKKFYIIYDAVFLDSNMQNAMLKTLEEPPVFVTFFLVTSNINTLLDTVKSRAMILIDDKEINYKELLSLDFADDAILQLSNIKYESETSKMFFAANFLKREDKFRDLIKLYRCILRDALFYKKTLSKKLFNINEKETEIVSIANDLSYEDIGILLDGLDELSSLKGYQIDKKIAVFNFLSGGKNGKVFRNKV